MFNPSTNSSQSAAENSPSGAPNEPPEGNDKSTCPPCSCLRAPHGGNPPNSALTPLAEDGNAQEKQADAPQKMRNGMARSRRRQRKFPDHFQPPPRIGALVDSGANCTAQLPLTQLLYVHRPLGLKLKRSARACETQVRAEQV